MTKTPTVAQTVAQTIAETHEHHAVSANDYPYHTVETCSCGARRYVGKETRLASTWAHPESTFCG